jgi:hypothetical protein
MDRMLESELGTFKQELRAQYMEQSLSIVQEANVLRKDVSLALHNERETRSQDVAELRKSLEAMQSLLMRELHETMDLVGSRLEQHLQESVHPDRLQSVITDRLELMSIINTAKSVQQGSLPSPSGGAGSSFQSRQDTSKEVNIERDARCRSIIDLRMEMERKIAENIGRSEQQCNAFAEELAALQETVETLAKHQASFRSPDESMCLFSVNLAGESMPPSAMDPRSMPDSSMDLTSASLAHASVRPGLPAQERGSLTRAVAENSLDNTARIEALNVSLGRLKSDFEQERSAWRSCMTELQYKIDLAMTSGSISSAEEVAAKASQFRKYLDEEREARTIVVKEIADELAAGLEVMRRSGESQASTMEEALKSEREARVREMCEMRDLLEYMSQSTGASSNKDISELKDRLLALQTWAAARGGPPPE